MAYTVEIYKFTAVLPEFVRFPSIAYRSLKEAATGLEWCQRLHPEASPDVIVMLITEGNQIRRMTYSLMQTLTRR